MYGRQSTYYDRHHGTSSRAELRVLCHSPRRARGGGRRAPETGRSLYARVSTDKQEREETVASQVDLLQQAAATHGYAVLPGNVCIDDGISGTRLDRPAAESERALIHERTRRGPLFAARQGRVNWGNPPYGDTYIRKTPTTPQP